LYIYIRFVCLLLTSSITHLHTYLFHVLSVCVQLVLSHSVYYLTPCDSSIYGSCSDMFCAQMILLNCNVWIIILGNIRWTNHTTLYYLWNQYLANMNVLTQQSCTGVLIREQFNNLSSSPLAFCQVQKPRLFFLCDPNQSSSHECYRGADKSLAWPTSQYILFDGENISFDVGLVIYINSTNIPPIMIIKMIHEHQNLL